MRFARFWLVASSLLVLPVMASAASLEKGASLLAIQLNRGVADLTGDTGDVLGTFQRPEVGFQGQYWYFMAKEYAVNVTGGIGYFKETENADPSAPLGFGNNTQTISSWQFRIGGDRFAQVSEKLQFFAGPGIQIWGGKFKYEDSSGESEQPSTTRYALSGRIGAHILMGENFGLMGHIGQYWGYATASADLDAAGEEAETKWLPSGSEGAMGFSFAF